MAVDDTITRAKTSENSTEFYKALTRMGQIAARKQCIERWAYDGRSSSINDSATTASAVLGASSAQKHSESTYSQAGRVLNIRLLQLSEQRQKLIERNNFDQKLFANKQALKYKDNQSVLRTLSYVRKCCKYADTIDNERTRIDPKIFLEEKSATKRSRSRSSSLPSPTLKRNLSANPRMQTNASMAETFLQHNKKHLRSFNSSPINRLLAESKTTRTTTATSHSNETATDDDSQKRHVQFQIQSDRTKLVNPSIQVTSKSTTSPIDKHIIRNVASANGVRSSTSSYDTRTTNSAPLVRTASATSDHSIEQIKTLTTTPRRSLSRLSSTKSSLEEFRLHPERFLSASNRYLPLLQRQAFEVQSKELHSKSVREKKARMHFSPPISRLSDGSDLTYDDAKSFLSEENELGKTQTPIWLEQDRKSRKKLQSPTKINLMNPIDDNEEANERRIALARLRDHEYSHLQALIHSNPIEEILEPFSAIKTDELNPIDKKSKDHENAKHRLIVTSQPTRIRQLNDILCSIDSLRCSDAVDRRKRRQIDIEKNRTKLGILIF